MAAPGSCTRIRFLLKLGFAINFRCDWNETALISAIKNDYCKIVTALEEKGVWLDMISAAEKTHGQCFPTASLAKCNCSVSLENICPGASAAALCSPRGNWDMMKRSLSFKETDGISRSVRGVEKNKESASLFLVLSSPI